MTIEIKARFGGKVLYTAENAADVREALVAAVKERADLRGADLRGADLGGADLGGAYDPNSPLFPIRLDVWAILDQAPSEVAGLRQALVDGKVDGSAYEGDCACLVGTIANVRGCELDALDIPRNSDRPAEQWFIPIRQGDVPVEDTTLETVSEGAFRATLAVQWIEEWRVSREAIVAAFQKAPLAS